MTDVIATAGAVKIVITGEGANFTDVTKDVNRQLELLGVKSKAVGGHMVSSVQAASGAIRILEGNVENNVRAVERFLVSSLKLGPVLQAAFPVVGALAFGGVIAKIGKDVHDFIKAAQEAPNAISQAFASSNSAMRLANDQLALANLHLENETAKLEKKPQNHLSEALLESQIQAGRLAESLERVSKAQQEAFKGQEVGWMQSNFLAKGDTSDVTNNIRNFQAQIVGRNYDKQVALDAGDKRTADYMQSEIARLQQDMIAYLRDQQKMRSGNTTLPNGAGILPYASVYGDQSANLAIIQGTLVQIQLSMASQRLGQQNATDQAANDEAKKKAAIRQQALEAQRKADEAVKQQWESQLAAMEAIHGKDLGQEADFWAARVATTIKGSTLQVEATRRMNQSLADLRTDTGRQSRDFGVNSDKAVSDIASGSDLSRSADGVKPIENQSRATIEWLKATNEAADALATNRDRQAELNIELALSQGQITKIAAAQQLATLHTQQYTAALDALRESQANAPTREVAAQYQAQINRLQGQYAVTQVQDYQAMNPAFANPMVALGDAFQQLTERSDDLRGAMEGLLSQIQSSLNDQIMNALSGKRTNFSNTAADLFRGVGGKVLDYGEGKLLSGLGLGGGKKPTGSASDPFYTRSADGSTGSTQGGFGGILSRLFGGQNGSSGGSMSGGGGAGDDGSVGGFGGFISDMATAIPFLAGGGPIAGAAIVGERGPELFVPRSSGTIVPNGKFGGDVHHHHTWNIDARGATDPAAINRAVQRGIMQAAPRLIGASVAAHRDDMRRRPSSQR